MIETKKEGKKGTEFIEPRAPAIRACVRKYKVNTQNHLLPASPRLEVPTCDKNETIKNND